MATLDNFESRLQSLLEVHLVKQLPGYRAEDGIARQFAITLHGNLKEVAGVRLAPNLFMITAHPSTLKRWQTKSRFIKEMADALYTAGKEAGLQFSLKPTITVTADASLPAHDLRIVASFSEEFISETHGISLHQSNGSIPGTGLGEAFLIVGGNQVFPLNQSVINIGRRLDNHIVIDDPRVSRAHAQLRMVKGHFVLFDLNSSGGTFVNNQRTHQAVLQPGDVISLAGVSLIFGHDLPEANPSHNGQTEPKASISVESHVPVSQKDQDPTK